MVETPFQEIFTSVIGELLSSKLCLDELVKTEPYECRAGETSEAIFILQMRKPKSKEV